MADLTYSGGTAVDFAESLLGNSVTVDTDPAATYFIGAAGQRAIFDDGNANAPDLTDSDSGVIFSTGTADQFNDDNTSNDFISTNYSGAGDADLDALETTDNATQDASGIYITFTADFTGEIRLSLTFATEEFPDYVITQYDDKAAVYFSELGDPLSLVDLPSTTADYYSVNDISLPPFVDNNSGAPPSQDQTDFNGYQANEEVTLDVVQGTTYVLKVAVADVSDGGYDTALLISALCFCAGTEIITQSGPQKVENLKVGQKVLTRDNGYQAIRWIGRSIHSGRGELAPILFAPGAIGNENELGLSPNHKVLLEGWRAELFLGQEEALIPAKHLVNDKTIYRDRRDRVVYFHILLENHELVSAHGIWSESFYPGPEALKTLDKRALSELKMAAPEFFENEKPEPIPITVARGYEGRAISAHMV